MKPRLTVGNLLACPCTGTTRRRGSTSSRIGTTAGCGSGGRAACTQTTMHALRRFRTTTAPDRRPGFSTLMSMFAHAGRLAHTCTTPPRCAARSAFTGSARRMDWRRVGSSATLGDDEQADDRGRALPPQRRPRRSRRALRGPLVHVPGARHGVAAPRGAVGRLSRPHEAAAHRRAARQHARVPLLAGRRRDQPLGQSSASTPRTGAPSSARLIDHTDCQVLVTSDTYADVLADAPSRCEPDRVLRDAHRPVRRTARRGGRRPHLGAGRRRRPLPADLHVRLDRVPEGGALHPGPVRAHRPHVARSSPSLGPGNAVYAPLPFFHSSSLFTGLVVRAATRRCRSEPRSSSPRRAPCPTSAGWAPRCSPTRARSSTTSSRCRRRPTTRLAARARVRQRGVRARHPRVRRPVRLHGARQLRLDRGHHHHPPRRVDARRARSGTADDNDRGARPRDRRGVPAGELRRRRPAR